MKVKNLRPWPVEIGETGQLVDAGASVDVRKDLGESLCEQPDNWEAVKAATKKDGDA